MDSDIIPQLDQLASIRKHWIAVS